MHIKDLKMDVELDGATLAAIRGGSYRENSEVSHGTSSCSCDSEPQPSQPGLPTFGSDPLQFGKDLEAYIGNAMPEMPSYDPMPYPGAGPLGGPY